MPADFLTADLLGIVHHISPASLAAAVEGKWLVSVSGQTGQTGKTRQYWSVALVGE